MGKCCHESNWGFFSRMARTTPLQKPCGTIQTTGSGSRPPLQIHFEAGAPAAVIEWRGRPRFKDHMALFKNAQLLCTPRMNKWTFMIPNIAPLPPITPICVLEHTCPAPTRCPKGSTSRGPRPTRSTVHAGVFRLQPPPAQVKYGHGTSECSSAVSKSGLIHNDQEVGGSLELRLYLTNTAPLPFGQEPFLRFEP